MKIKSKLMILVAGSIVLFAAAAASYFAFLSPIDRMQVERDFFGRAVEAGANLRIETGKLATAAVISQREAFDQAVSRYWQALADLSQVKYLPEVSEPMRDAVTACMDLRALSDQTVGQMDMTLDDVTANAKASLSNPANSGLVEFFNITDADLVQGDATVIRNGAIALLSTIRLLDDVLAATNARIKESYSAIDEEIVKVRIRSLGIVSAVIFCIVAAVLLLSFLMARSITRSLEHIGGKIEQMSGGDLTVVCALASRDEIGQLAADLDKLLDNFNRSLGEIQSASGRNVEVKTQLVVSASTATMSADEIEANSRSMRGQMEHMDEMIASSRVEAGMIVDTITTFNERMAAQNRHVEESVAAVTEMLASIANISRITGENRAAAETLVREAGEGREVFEASVHQVMEVSENVAAIKEMASVIAGIASQTNILAMNAAIEAAHAGDYGRGFAVVADEIAKLAAASATSSQEIASTIKAVVGRIAQAAGSSDVTLRAFDSIARQISQLTDSVNEIYGSITEIQTGSHQVLGAMEELRSSSRDMTDESGRIGQGAGELGQAMDSIGRISGEIVTNIGEISVGMGEITRTIRDLSVHSDAIGQIGSELDRAVNRFQVRKGAA